MLISCVHLLVFLTKVKLQGCLFCRIVVSISVTSTLLTVFSMYVHLKCTMVDGSEHLLTRIYV